MVRHVHLIGWQITSCDCIWQTKIRTYMSNYPYSFISLRWISCKELYCLTINHKNLNNQHYYKDHMCISVQVLTGVTEVFRCCLKTEFPHIQVLCGVLATKAYMITLYQIYIKKPTNCAIVYELHNKPSHATS